MLDNLLEILPQRQEKLRVLIVDDQPINIRALHEVFRGEYHLIMATNGQQAIEQARKQLPDLILLDVVMPDMNGYDVCQQLKSDAQTASIPVIFVTTQSNPDEEALGFEAGAVDFIIKPVNPVIVRARVRTHLALKLQYDFVRSIALQDGLTGIPNRRRFDDDFASYWGQARREQWPLSLLLIDVDHFKLYNDHYGHVAGDVCLRSVAQALVKTARRSTDLVYRYGGEEFACLLPHTDLQGAEQCAASMLEAVAALNIEHCKSATAPVVSISIGIVSVIPDQDHKQENMVELADKALYDAKHAGRNGYRSSV
ncbi:diguanylate cyclase response regulator [Pokkaliibacter plantistimulans]|uniref:diguanylate cyclase n=2 Tax=Pseudomonadota TaxID=1224 RepID=A0A2S5KXM6_9PROT|nr:diguanylate cyclase response regulator [Pokkaliibacter plantistimulans]